MKDNLIFHFDQKTTDGRELRGEDCATLIKVFIGEHLHIPDTRGLCITVAHRLGKFNKDYKRPIIAKFPFANQLQLVLDNANRLDATNRRLQTSHFITRQMPASMIERKKHALPTFTELKKDPNNKAYLARSKLFLKGKLQTQFTEPVLPYPTISSDSASDCVITESEPTTEGGSSFKGYAANVNSLQDVSMIRTILSLKEDVAIANHLIMAYRFTEGPNNKIVENFSSDGDHGVGLELLKSMKNNHHINYALFATRTCSPDYVHIGKKRFEHVIQVCKDAIDKL